MAHSTSQTAFLTIEKSFTYRGAREHWVNTYHVDQVPPDATHWKGLSDAIALLEQQCFTSDVQFEHNYGHTPGTPPVLVWEEDVPPAGEGGAAGTWVPSGADVPCPGDSALWMRYATTQRNTLGKPIYLRNYYHGIWHSGSPDTPAAAQVTRFNTLGSALVAGVNVSGTTFRRAGPRGAVAQNHLVGQFLTTRTLKHRGRRHRWSPTSAPAGYKWILTNVPQEIN